MEPTASITNLKGRWISISWERGEFGCCFEPGFVTNVKATKAKSRKLRKVTVTVDYMESPATSDILIDNYTAGRDEPSSRQFQWRLLKPGTRMSDEERNKKIKESQLAQGREPSCL